jgi:molybdate transport system ATP-binding protein
MDDSKGEQWAVVGPNGAGKTLLADFLQRKHAFKSGHLWLAPTEHGETTIRSIAFKDIYSLTDVRNTYYQQRWQATEVEESAVVADLIGENISDDAKHILARFGLRSSYTNVCFIFPVVNCVNS